MRITVKEELKKGDYDRKGVRQMRISLQHGGAQAVVLVALDGWNHDQYDYRGREKYNRSRDSKGMQIRLSSNAALRMTVDEWHVLRDTIDAAYDALRDHAVADEHVPSGRWSKPHDSRMDPSHLNAGYESGTGGPTMARW